MLWLPSTFSSMRVTMAIAVRHVGMVDRDECGEPLVVVLARVATLLERANDQRLGSASRVARIADEPRLGLAPLVQVAITCCGRQRPDLEIAPFALDLAQALLAAAHALIRHRALVLRAELLLQVRPPPTDPDEHREEHERRRDAYHEHDPFQGVHCDLLVSRKVPAPCPRETCVVAWDWGHVVSLR